MDIFSLRAMTSMFRRKSILERELKKRENPQEISSSTVERLSIAQIKRKWRRKQIKNQEKQATFLDSWRLKQMWNWTFKSSNLQENIQNYGEGNRAIRGDSVETDSNPSAHASRRSAQASKTIFICMSQSSTWQKNRGTPK
jgi:hypothetical protein